jgi:hypothetical protein
MESLVRKMVMSYQITSTQANLDISMKFVFEKSKVSIRSPKP